MVNRKRLIRLIQKLISIDSQNPPGDERKIACFVKDYLDRLGLKTRIHEFRKKRSNVVSVLKGSSGAGTLLITPHLDTVPSGRNWDYDPFSGTIRKGRIYGLGATDCKGNLASAMEAINSIVENKAVLDYNLVLAATADEESGSGLGLIPLLAKGLLRPDAAIVLDANDFNIVVAQKGLIHMKVKIQGKRAHGAYPWLGINAIDIAVRILRELKARRWKYKANKYLKAPTLNIGTIKGGDKVNVVSDWCEFELDCRFLPGMSSGDIIKDIKETVSRFSRKFEIGIEGVQKPYVIDHRHPLVAGLARAMAELNAPAKISGSEGATVITFFQDKKIPALASGFGSGHCEHAQNEYVTIDNLYKGARVLESFLTSYKHDGGLR